MTATTDVDLRATHHAESSAFEPTEASRYSRHFGAVGPRRTVVRALDNGVQFGHSDREHAESCCDRPVPRGS
jgi:hypothetical protein